MKINNEHNTRASLVLINPDATIQGDYFGKVTTIEDAPVFSPRGRAVHIKEIREYWETGEYQWVLSYQLSGCEQEIEIDRGEINRSGLLKLSARGVDVYEHNVGTLIKVLQNEESVIEADPDKKKYLHRGIGWDTVNYRNGEAQKIFRADKVFGEFESSYSGQLDIKPRGSLKKWKAFLRTEVMGSPQLETAVILGLTAVTSSFMKTETKLENIIVHVMGESSSGKTTAACLALSTTAKPEFGNATLLKSWGATANGLRDSVLDNHGMVVVFDEISKFRGQDLTDMVYYFAEGSEKLRSNVEGNVRPGRTFETTIISTGEGSILNRCKKKNSGLAVRVCEFEAQWTKDAAHSQRIKEGSIRNYGHAAPLLASLLQEKDMQEIMSRYDFWREKYLSLREYSDLEARVGERYAMIMLTAELSAEALNLPFDLDAILDFLVKNDRQFSSVKNIGKEAHGRFLAYLQSHHYHFIKSGADIKETQHPDDMTQDGFPEMNYPMERVAVWGVIKSIRVSGIRTLEFAILRDIAEKILTDELGYEDAKLVLRQMKKWGLLDCEKDRLYRTRKINLSGTGIDSEVYVIRAIPPRAELDGKTGRNTASKNPVFPAAK